MGDGPRKACGGPAASVSAASQAPHLKQRGGARFQRAATGRRTVFGIAALDGRTLRTPSRSPRSRHSQIGPCADEEAKIMRMHLRAVLLAALVGPLGAVQPAVAAHCGAAKYDCCPEPCCDAQCCYTSCQQQCRTCYKLVYDKVLEKRWHTCYQNIQETVMKQVCKTCYREECKTCYKSCY